MRKPTVGDRVRIISFPQQPQTVGEVVTVYKVTEREQFPLWVRFDDRKYPESCLYYDEVELI